MQRGRREAAEDTRFRFRGVESLGCHTNNTLQDGKSHYTYNFSRLKMEVFFSDMVLVFISNYHFSPDLWMLWNLKVPFLGCGNHICISADNRYLNPSITNERFIFPSLQS